MIKEVTNLNIFKYLHEYLTITSLLINPKTNHNDVFLGIIYLFIEL